MPMTPRHLAILLAVALPACGLGGCASINEKLSAGMGDVIPQWAGGLPADAPPRRGTPQYDEYMKERERKRLEPAATADGAKPASPSSASSPSSTASTSSNASTSSKTSASSALALDPVH
jgi:hypothetical protein